MTSKARSDSIAKAQIPSRRLHQTRTPGQARPDQASDKNCDDDRQTISDSSTDYLSTATTATAARVAFTLSLSSALTTAADIQATFGYISDRLTRLSWLQQRGQWGVMLAGADSPIRCMCLESGTLDVAQELK